MKKITAIVLFALFSTALPSQITVSGTISAEHFNEPLESCFVRLRPISPTGKADSTTTNNKGQYFLSNTWPGVYILSAGKADYLVDSLEVVINKQDTVDLKLLKTDHSFSTALPDSLMKAKSPFFITQAMIIDHSIFIEKGVYIYIKYSLELNGPSVLAAGGSSDSIWFKGLDTNSCLLLASSNLTFALCSFNNINRFILSNSQMHISIDACSFYSINQFSSNTSGLISFCSGNDLT